jgi:hypothetical protein
MGYTTIDPWYLYRAKKAKKRPAKPPAEPMKGALFAAAAFELEVALADPVLVALVPVVPK